MSIVNRLRGDIPGQPGASLAVARNLPSTVRSNPGCSRGLPGPASPERPSLRVWEPKPVGKVGTGAAPVGRAYTRETFGENLEPEARQEAQGFCSVLSSIPLGP